MATGEKVMCNPLLCYAAKFKEHHKGQQRVGLPLQRKAMLPVLYGSPTKPVNQTFQTLKTTHATSKSIPRAMLAPLHPMFSHGLCEEV
eukprot:CAMPEP_0204204232 /NCGR_PEP_ID=MMETSP0361-20130328/69477_1 /ASSEMBLY_ACC=CAM_ASM_000343 /TAXON_ID=268821 /ORGANISM="Scrippsiella Hangoei, Strain SHTV-5" /LENGTH=87 /DNA_ID=CAMNT_0051167299 /DNA_START=88 /DNA_END=348 /DNA_ORIENTATION=+